MIRIKWLGGPQKKNSFFSLICWWILSCANFTYRLYITNRKYRKWSCCYSDCFDKDRQKIHIRVRKRYISIFWKTEYYLKVTFLYSWLFLNKFPRKKRNLRKLTKWTQNYKATLKYALNLNFESGFLSNFKHSRYYSMYLKLSRFTIETQFSKQWTDFWN